MVNKNLTTEGRNQKTLNFDLASTREKLELINGEDKLVPLAVEKEINHIEEAVELITNALNNGGRLVYMGAGTSGRLGILDSVECNPTFGVDHTKVVGIIAGGDKAFTRAVEGAEDSKELAISDMKDIYFGEKDILVAIAASGRTPYAIGAAEYAKSLGAKTIALTCNKNSILGEVCHVKIEVEVGPEVLTGSTRMKAGTAQKLVLNMLSTASMGNIGKVYENLMIDVQVSNLKLQERAIGIVMQITGCEYDRAKEVLVETKNDVKLATIMLMLNISIEEAKTKLVEANGIVRKAL